MDSLHYSLCFKKCLAVSITKHFFMVDETVTFPVGTGSLYRENGIWAGS